MTLTKAEAPPRVFDLPVWSAAFGVVFCLTRLAMVYVPIAHIGTALAWLGGGLVFASVMVYWERGRWRRKEKEADEAESVE